MSYIQDNPNKKVNVSELVPTIISKEIEWKCQEAGFRQFRNFVVVKTDFSKLPGDTLSIPKIDDLPAAQELDETSTLRGSGKKLSLGSVTIYPTEKGDEVQYTEYSKLTSQNELQSIVVELLARQSAKKENLDIRDVMFNEATQVYYAGGVESATDVTQQIAYTDIDAVVEQLEADEAPKFGGGSTEHFVAFIHPYVRRCLIDSMRSVDQYALTVPNLYAGEIGMYNRTRFIETAYCPFRTAVSISSQTLSAAVTPDKIEKPGTYTFTSSTVAFTPSTSGATSQTAYFFVSGASAAQSTLSSADYAKDIWVGTTSTITADDTDNLIMFPANGYSAGTTGTLTVAQHILTKVLADRHLAYGAIKPVTMLGAEAFDYGRIIGIAWNAFYDTTVLNDKYGWVIEALR